MIVNILTLDILSVLRVSCDIRLYLYFWLASAPDLIVTLTAEQDEPKRDWNPLRLSQKFSFMNWKILEPLRWDIGISGWVPLSSPDFRRFSTSGCHLCLPNRRAAGRSWSETHGKSRENVTDLKIYDGYLNYSFPHSISTSAAFRSSSDNSLPVRTQTGSPAKVWWEPTTQSGLHKRLSSILPTPTWPVPGRTN